MTQERNIGAVRWKEMMVQNRSESDEIIIFHIENEEHEICCRLYAERRDKDTDRPGLFITFFEYSDEIFTCPPQSPIIGDLLGKFLALATFVKVPISTKYLMPYQYIWFQYEGEDDQRKLPTLFPEAEITHNGNVTTYVVRITHGN